MLDFIQHLGTLFWVSAVIGLFCSIRNGFFINICLFFVLSLIRMDVNVWTILCGWLTGAITFWLAAIIFIWVDYIIGIILD